MSLNRSQRTLNLQGDSSSEDVQIIDPSGHEKTSQPSKANSKSRCHESCKVTRDHQHFDTHQIEKIPESPATMEVPMIVITTRDKMSLVKLEQDLSSRVGIVYQEKDINNLKLTLIVRAQHFIKVVNLITSGSIVSRNNVHIEIKDYVIKPDHELATEVAAYKDFEANIKAFLAQLKTVLDQDHHSKESTSLKRLQDNCFFTPPAKRRAVVDTMTGKRKFESSDDYETDADDVIMIESLTKEDKIETVEIGSPCRPSNATQSQTPAAIDPVTSLGAIAMCNDQVGSDTMDESRLMQMSYIITSLQSPCPIDHDSLCEFSDFIKKSLEEILAGFNDMTTTECIHMEPPKRKWSVGILVAPWAFQACIKGLNVLQYKQMNIVARGMIKPKYVRKTKPQIERILNNIHNTGHYWINSHQDKLDLRCRSVNLPVLDLKFSLEDEPDFAMYEKIFISCGITVAAILKKNPGRLCVSVLPCNLNTGLEKLTKILVLEYHLKPNGKQTRLHLAMAGYCEQCMETVGALKGSIGLDDIAKNTTDSSDGGTDAIIPIVKQVSTNHIETIPPVSEPPQEHDSGTICTFMDQAPVDTHYQNSSSTNVDNMDSHSVRKQTSDLSMLELTHNDMSKVNALDLINVPQSHESTENTPILPNHVTSNEHARTSIPSHTISNIQTQANSLPLPTGIPGQTLVNQSSGKSVVGQNTNTDSTHSDLNTILARGKENSEVPLSTNTGIEDLRSSRRNSDIDDLSHSELLDADKAHAENIGRSAILPGTENQEDPIEVLVPHIIVSRQDTNGSLDEVLITESIIDHLKDNEIEVLHLNGDSDKHVVVDPSRISDAVNLLLKYDCTSPGFSCCFNVELATDPMVIMVSGSTQAKYHLIPIDEWDGQWKTPEIVIKSSGNPITKGVQVGDNTITKGAQVDANNVAMVAQVDCPTVSEGDQVDGNTLTTRAEVDEICNIHDIEMSGNNQSQRNKTIPYDFTDRIILSSQLSVDITQTNTNAMSSHFPATALPNDVSADTNALSMEQSVFNADQSTPTERIISDHPPLPHRSSLPETSDILLKNTQKHTVDGSEREMESTSVVPLMQISFKEALMSPQGYSYREYNATHRVPLSHTSSEIIEDVGDRSLIVPGNAKRIEKKGLEKDTATVKPNSHRNSNDEPEKIDPMELREDELITESMCKTSLKPSVSKQLNPIEIGKPYHIKTMPIEWRNVDCNDVVVRQIKINIRPKFKKGYWKKRGSKYGQGLDNSLQLHVDTLLKQLKKAVHVFPGVKSNTLYPHIVVPPMHVEKALETIEAYTVDGKRVVSANLGKLMLVRVGAVRKKIYELVTMKEWKKLQHKCNTGNANVDNTSKTSKELKRKKNLDGPASRLRSADAKVWILHMVAVRFCTRKKFRDHNGQNYDKVKISKIAELKKELENEGIKIFKTIGQKIKQYAIPPMQVKNALTIISNFKITELDLHPFSGEIVDTNYPLPNVPVDIQKQYCLLTQEGKQQQNLKGLNSSCSSKPKQVDQNVAAAHTIGVKCKIQLKKHCRQDDKQFIRNKLGELQASLKHEKIHIFKTWGKNRKRFALPPGQVPKALSIIRSFKTNELDFAPFIGYKCSENYPVKGISENNMNRYGMKTWNEEDDWPNLQTKKRPSRIDHGIELTRVRGPVLSTKKKKISKYNKHMEEEIEHCLLMGGVSTLGLYPSTQTLKYTYVIELLDQAAVERALGELHYFRCYARSTETWQAKQLGMDVNSSSEVCATTTQKPTETPQCSLDEHKLNDTPKDLNSNIEMQVVHNAMQVMEQPDPRKAITKLVQQIHERTHGQASSYQILS
ncbi:unnamed protein product [Owenia fusiformis]|uniref:Uncharacterized protein n=1 Tax=Owenia fusiformis TaxID=6347 RepID=A0A8S4Q167_OWEFU|nr:unnamed protein product [Owenia fusiformis]